MTRRISFISIIGAALVLAAPAFGQGSRYSFEKPQWQVALEARSEGMNKQHGLGDYSPAMRALELRSQALNQQYGLGAYNPTAMERLIAREQAFEVKGQVDSTSAIDAREEAFGAKREAQLVAGGAKDVFERTVIAATRETTPVVVDDRFRIDPTANPVPVEVTSGREIEWPQVGTGDLGGAVLGLGVGLLLGLGLLLAMRYTRIRPPAH